MRQRDERKGWRDPKVIRFGLIWQNTQTDVCLPNTTRPHARHARGFSLPMDPLNCWSWTPVNMFYLLTRYSVDNTKAIEDSCVALKELIAEGVLVSVGLCNASTEHARIAATVLTDKLVSVQNRFNLWCVSKPKHSQRRNSVFFRSLCHCFVGSPGGSLGFKGPGGREGEEKQESRQDQQEPDAAALPTRGPRLHAVQCARWPQGDNS